MSSDGDNASSADTTQVATEVEPTLEEAMQSIFAACDADSAGAVHTANLIEYISPFMAHNRTELMQLQEMLDPRDENVRVSKEKFYAVMNEWAGRIGNVAATAAANESQNFLEAVPKEFYQIEEEDCPFVQSTPRSSFGRQFLKRYSNISLISESTATPSTAADKTVFEERLKELTHQNKKLTEELTHAKVQLTSSEEYIENLQAELNQAVHRLNSEQQTNEQLQKCVSESENIKEISGDVQVQFNHLKKERDGLEKENATLKKLLDALDDEKTELMQLVEKYRKNKLDLEQKLLEANKEVQLNEEKIGEMEEVIKLLKVDVKELQSAKESYKQRTEELLSETQTLQKFLYKFQLQQQTSAATTSRSGVSSPQNLNTTSTLSPLEKFRQLYNSPNLLNQLNNPLSPLENTPEEKICQNSPKFVSKVKSSTPNQAENLLDDGVAMEIAKNSVLTPQSTTYVIENAGEDGQKSAENVGNNTSEEDYWKINLTQILESQSPQNSLLAEISEVVNGNCASGNDCVHLIRLMEVKSDFFKLQQELQEQKIELEEVQKQNDVLNQSAGSNSSTTYVTEVRVRLEQENEDEKAADLSKLEEEIKALRLKLKVAQETNEKLTNCHRESQKKCEIFVLDLEKVAKLYEDLKIEMHAVLAENCLLKGMFEKNTKLKAQIDDLHRQYVAEKMECARNIEELRMRIGDFSMEVTVLQQKLEKSQVLDACVGCNLYEDDVAGVGREKSDNKSVLSFSKLQIKVDKMQEKIENLEELLRKKSKELQLQIDKDVALKSENNVLKQELAETGLERNQFELKLVEANTVLKNAEVEVFELKNALENLMKKAVELKEMEIKIVAAVHCIYESNVDMVSLLKETILSHCVNSPLITVLNSWTDSLNNNSNRLDVFLLNLPKQPTFDDVLKVLTEHVKDLRGMVLFNKQFSQTLKNLLQEISLQVSVKSLSVKPPESPDSPSVNDENIGVVFQGACKKVGKGDADEDFSSSEISLDDLEKWSLSSDCKEDNTHTFPQNFKEISFNRAFPNLSDALLESLNTQTDRIETINATELEENYTILMTTLATDALSIRVRHEKQTRALNEERERFLAQLKQAEKCTVRDITRDFCRVCALAEVSGALREEVKVHKCLQSIRNYVVVLKKKVGMQQQDVRIIPRFSLQKITYQKTAMIIYLHKYLKNGAKFLGSIFETSKRKSSTLKNCGRGILRFFYYGVCILIFLTIFTILGNIVSDTIFSSSDSSVRRFSYPFRYMFWDELLAPISKKVYCVKECPH